MHFFNCFTPVKSAATIRHSQSPFIKYCNGLFLSNRICDLGILEFMDLLYFLCITKCSHPLQEQPEKRQENHRLLVSTPFAIEKNNNIRTVQAESSNFASLSFDQGFQIVTPPRIVANVQ